MIENCNIYGSGSLFGEGLIYSEWCEVLCYDFGINLYDTTTSLPLSGFYWSLYKRDYNKPPDDIIDTTHILVDSGQSLADMLEIDLNQYKLKYKNDDYLITSSMTTSASNAPDLNSVYIKYYYTEYTKNNKNCPYSHNNIAITTSGTSCGSGIIEVEPNRWQLVSIPIKYGYWDSNLHKHIHDDVTIARIKNYVVDQIEDVYGVDANTMVEVFNTYFGDVNKYYNFIPNVTDPLSIHNFELGYQDTNDTEYTGFWIKSVYDSVFLITWGE